MLSQKYFWREWYVVVYERLGGNDRQYHSGTCQGTGLTYIHDNWKNYVIMVASSDDRSKVNRIPKVQWYARKSLSAENLYYQRIKFAVNCKPNMLAGVFEKTEYKIIAPANRKFDQSFHMKVKTGEVCGGRLGSCSKVYTEKDYVVFGIQK